MTSTRFKVTIATLCKSISYSRLPVYTWEHCQITIPVAIIILNEAVSSLDGNDVALLASRVMYVALLYITGI